MRTVFHLVLGRRGFLGVGLLVLALWTQALAPAAALRMLSALSDPLLNPVICGHAATVSDDGGEVEQPASTLPDCDLCQLCCAGITLPTLPRIAAVTRNLCWQPVVWPIPPPTTSTLPSCHLRQPRAPPSTA